MYDNKEFTWLVFDYELLVAVQFACNINGKCGDAHAKYSFLLKRVAQEGRFISIARLKLRSHILSSPRPVVILNDLVCFRRT